MSDSSGSISRVKNKTNRALAIGFALSLFLARWSEDRLNPGILMLVSDPQCVDLSDVDQLGRVPFQFTLENRGGAILITDVMKPCTCTEIDIQ